MKKRLFLLLSVLFPFFISNSQTNQEVTILYLLPFHLEDGYVVPEFLKNSDEIHEIQQFEMMGFWLGAKMALKEYEYSKKKINVIVRDAVTNKNALKKVLNDTLLMAKVNIMMGPIYGSLFSLAAEYAEKHNIIIVNPFSTRYDFVEKNSAVYKLTPPFISRPKAVATHLLAHPERFNVILWGDSATSIELQVYKYYFNEHEIKYKEVHTLTIPQDARKTNLIIALFDQPERVIHGIHTLINQEEGDENEYNRILIVPESWLSLSELTEDFYNLPDLYFFTNYFVDENSTRAKQFQFDYTFFNEAPAELAGYNYQGYDITRYFIDLFFADLNPEEVQFQPLSYQFQWKQILDGGLENTKVRLIRVKDLGFEEVK